MSNSIENVIRLHYIFTLFTQPNITYHLLIPAHAKRTRSVEVYHIFLKSRFQSHPRISWGSGHEITSNKVENSLKFGILQTLDRTEHWIYFGELIFSVCSSILVYLKQYLQRKISNTARYNRNFFWWRKSIRDPYRVIFITRDCCQYYCTAVRCFSRHLFKSPVRWE